MADWNEHVLNVRARLDKTSKQEMIDSVRGVFAEGANIDFNSKENLRGLHDLADVMRKIFSAAGNTTIDFTEMIKLPGPELFDGLKEAAKDFESVWNSVIANMGSFSLKDIFMEDASGISMAMDRISKNGKVIEKDAKRIMAAFEPIKSKNINKLLGDATELETVFTNSSSWEERTTAALKYLNVYERIAQIEDDIDVRDIDREFAKTYKNITNKDYKLGGLYSIDSLKAAIPQMQTSLQNIFNMALGKPLLGLLEGGRINLEFAPVVIKKLDVGDLFDKKGEKGTIGIPVAPEIDPSFQEKLSKLWELAQAKSAAKGTPGFKAVYSQYNEQFNEILNMFPEDKLNAVEARLERFTNLKNLTDQTLGTAWKDFSKLGLSLGGGDGSGDGFGFGMGEGTGSGDGDGSGDASSAELANLKKQLADKESELASLREEFEATQRSINAYDTQLNAERDDRIAAEQREAALMAEIEVLRQQIANMPTGGVGGGDGAGITPEDVENANKLADTVQRVEAAYKELDALNADPFKLKNEEEVNRILQERLAIIQRVGAENLKAYNQEAYEGVEYINDEYLRAIDSFRESKDDEIYNQLDENFGYDNEIIESSQTLEVLLAKRRELMQGIYFDAEQEYLEQKEINAAIERRIALMKELEPLVESGAISKDTMEEMVYERSDIELRRAQLESLLTDQFGNEPEDIDEAQNLFDQYEKILVETGSGKKLTLGPEMSPEDWNAFTKCSIDAIKSIEFFRKEIEKIPQAAQPAKASLEELYNNGSEAAKKAIQDMAIANNKLKEFDKMVATNPESRNQFIPLSEEEKAKFLNVAKEYQNTIKQINDLEVVAETEDDKQRLIDLKTEAIKLHKVLAQALIRDGNIDNYIKEYGLSRDEAEKFYSSIQDSTPQEFIKQIRQEYEASYDDSFDRMEQLNPEFRQQMFKDMSELEALMDKLVAAQENLNRVEPLAPSTQDDTEVESLGKIREEVNKITGAVKEKTQEFLNEQTAVKKAAQSEVHALGEVEKKVNAIRVALSNVNTLLNNIKKGKDIGSGLSNININVNHKKDEKKSESVSINKDQLKSALREITYKVKIAHDDNDKNANKVAINAEDLEGVLRRVFNPTAGIDAEQPSTATAAGIDVNGVKAETDVLIEQYRGILRTIEEWKTLYAQLKTIEASGTTDFRKQMLPMLENMSPELVKMIGGSFAENFAKGFKGVKTKDILGSLSYITNADLLGSVTDQVDMLNKIDFSKFSFDGLEIKETNIEFLREAFELLQKIDEKKKEIAGVGTSANIDADIATERPKEQPALEKTLLSVKGILEKIAANTASLNGVEIQRAVEKNTVATEGVAPEVAKETSTVATEGANNIAKIIEKKRTDENGNVGEYADNRTVVRGQKTSDSYQTTKTHMVPEFDEETEEFKGYKTTLVEIIDDFDKIRKENIKAEKDLVRAQKKVSEFLAKFQSKTGGNAQYVDGFSQLQNMAEHIDTSNIDIAYNKMIELQQKYAELERNFRKGQSSLNPFVNAINKSQNIGNIFGDVEDKFNGLTEKSEKLTEHFGKLKELSDQIQSFTKRMETDSDSIAPADFTKFSKQMGEFTSLKTQVDSMIRSEKAAEKEANAKSAERAKEIKSLASEYEKLGKLRAKFEGSRDLGDREELRVLAEQVKQKRESLELTTEEVLALREKSAEAYKTERRLINAAKEQKALDDQRKAAEKEAKDSSKQTERDEKKRLANEKRMYQKQAMVGKAGSAVGRAENTWISAVALETEGKDAIPAAFKAQVDEYRGKLEELRKKQEEVRNTAAPVTDAQKEAFEQQTKELVNQINSVNKLTDEIGGLVSEYQKLSGSNVDETKTQTTALTNKSPLADYEAQLKRYAKSITDGKAQIKSFNAETKTLTYTVKTGKNEFTEYTAAVRHLDHQMVAVQGTTKRAETFFEATTRKMKELTSYFSGMAIFNRIGQELRRGIQYVREIDLALTELKKVTDETEETYDRFLNTAAKTADKVGSTIQKVVSSTADWARLGSILAGTNIRPII